MKSTVLSHISANYPWKEQFQYFPSIGSTNDMLKNLARQGAPHGTVLLAGHQTAGHGRLGRSFHSPENVGIYLSILLRPMCAPSELLHLTCATAVAMCDAIERSCGFRPGIKWTNDLVYKRKKLGGILTELGFTAQGMVDYAIIGIGINCAQQQEDFPQDIQEIATSLSMVTENTVDRSVVAAAMMDALYTMDQQLLSHQKEILQQYRKDCITIGQDISLLRGDAVRYGTALDVDESGALIVRFTDNTISPVNSGEVSVRGMYGYI